MSQNTISGMAKKLGVEPHQIRYAIESRGIKPEGRVGNTDTYGIDALNAVSTTINAIRRRSKSSGRGTNRGNGRETRIMPV